MTLQISVTKPYVPGGATGITLGSTPLVGGVNATVAGLTLSSGTLAGTTTVTGLTIINLNAATLPVGPTGTLLQLGQANGVQTRLTLDSFATNGNISYRRAEGTASAPTALLLGSTIGAFGAFGYGATGYTTTSRAGISFTPAENWTDTAQGAFIAFSTTAVGAATPNTEKMRLSSTGGLALGIITDPGAGNLLVSGTVKTGVYTVATLPTAGIIGRRAMVSDALALAFGGVVVGGGANACPVYDSGVAWGMG